MRLTRFSLIVFVLIASFPSMGRGTESDRGNSPPNLREISITAMVDHDYIKERGKDKVREEIESIIGFASKVFEREFQTTFLVDSVEPWEFTSGKKKVAAQSALNDLTSVFWEHKGEVIIGFTRRDLYLCRKQDESNQTLECSKEDELTRAGLAFILGNEALVSLDSNVNKTTLHELGHVFGADHVKELSVMQEVPLVSTFDETNKKIILANRLRKFR